MLLGCLQVSEEVPSVIPGVYDSNCDSKRKLFSKGKEVDIERETSDSLETCHSGQDSMGSRYLALIRQEVKESGRISWSFSSYCY